MTVVDRFPVELLNAPIEQRIRYFENYTVAHPHLIKAREKLITSLSEPASAGIIFVFGPTGVGKTTLLQRTVQKMTDQSLEEFEKDKGRIFSAGFEAPAPDLQNYNWTDFYVRGLESLRDPLINLDGHLLARINGARNSKAMLRLWLEKALQHRRPKFFYVDEAQNLGKVSTGRHLKDQADCIKSISNLSGVPILLVGTYELLYLRNLSAQLCRRSTDIHYPRYRLDIAGDEKAFKNIVATFQRHLPLNTQPMLTDNWEFCYERSLGCIGILKDWLSRTLAGTLLKMGDVDTITLADLEKYAYSPTACSTMLREIREEENIIDKTVSRSDLRIALGLAPLANLNPDLSSNLPKTKSSKPRLVGELNPKRRAIGDTKNAN